MVTVNVAATLLNSRLFELLGATSALHSRQPSSLHGQMGSDCRFGRLRTGGQRDRCSEIDVAPRKLPPGSRDLSGC